MTEQTPSYSVDEVSLLKLGREMRELVENPAWKSFQTLLQAQLEMRRRVLATPLHALTSQEFQGMDFTSKAMQIESIKGAIIGLTLAHDLPSLTIQQASEIIRENSQEIEDAN